MAELLRRSAAGSIFFTFSSSSAARIFLASLSLLLLAGIISLPYLRSPSVCLLPSTPFYFLMPHKDAFCLFLLLQDEPYLCRKEGVILRCPDVSFRLLCSCDSITLFFCQKLLRKKNCIYLNPIPRFSVVSNRPGFDGLSNLNAINCHKR